MSRPDQKSDQARIKKQIEKELQPARPTAMSIERHPSDRRFDNHDRDPVITVLRAFEQNVESFQYVVIARLPDQSNLRVAIHIGAALEAGFIIGLEVTIALRAKLSGSTTLDDDGRIEGTDPRAVAVLERNGELSKLARGVLHRRYTPWTTRNVSHANPRLTLVDNGSPSLHVDTLPTTGLFGKTSFGLSSVLRLKAAIEQVLT